MKQFPSSILIVLVLFALGATQTTTIAYLEGCSAYASDGCCQSCQYGYSLSNGGCLKNNNETSDCCQSYNSDGSCAKCSSGLYFADPYCLRNLIYGCIKKSGNTCLACGSGLALQNGLCYTVIPNCSSYSASGVCNACVSGFALVNNYCVEYPQVANCAQSNYYGCIVCSNGYYLTSNQTCAPFAPGCLKYFRGSCLSCLPSYYLSRGICTIDGCVTFEASGCSQCQTGFELDHGKCYLNNCAKLLNNTCLACKQSYRLSSNGCVKQTSYSCKACQSGYIFLNNHCQKIIYGCLNYTSSNLCGVCSTNFQLTVNGFCQIVGCAQYNQNGCLACTTPFQLVNSLCTISNCLTITATGCTNCSSGYFLNNNQCYLADPNCLTYLNSTCVQCIAKYHFSNGICTPNERGCVYNSSGVCSCAGNFILSSCGKCIVLGCSSYDANDNCLSCNSPFSFNSVSGNCFIANCQTYLEISCKACLPGYLLANGQCQQSDIYCITYNSNGVCTSCQSGFFIDSTSGKCIKNVPNCASYSDQVTCQSCKSGFLLLNGSCISKIDNCLTQSGSACLKCNSGYHLNLANCVINDANCANYTIQNCTQFCTSCSSGYYILQGICTKQVPGCIYNGSNCINCTAPFLFDSTCNSCFIFGCLTYSSLGCLSCKSPFTLLNNTCTISNCLNYNKDNCTSCATGFALTNGVCVSLDVNCLTFNNNQCTGCKQGFSLLNGKCVIKDVNCDSYKADGTCFKCIQSCFLDKNKICKTKDFGCVYEYGECKYCNAPFELDQVANTCVIKNCLQANITGCLLCKNPFIVSNGGCTLLNCNNVQNSKCVQCKSGYHLKKGVFCEIDSLNCLSYDSDGNCQLCKTGLTLTSNAQCSQLNSTCLQTCEKDKTKCLSCATGYFLNKFFQCEKQDGNCIEYTNGVCSQCSDRYFLFSEICFPYTAGCAQYSGKDCASCKSGYVLKNGECFKWNQQDLSFLGSDDKYNFSITPIDVRQSKYYINNLSPGSSLGKYFFSSYFDESYEDCSLSTLSGAQGKGWKAAKTDSSQYIGLTISDQPLTFYAVQLEAVEGNYITEFYLEYSTDGTNFIRVQNAFQVPSSVSENMTTIYFTGIYAKAIRIMVSKYQGWAACRVDFFYYDLIRFRKISNLKSLKYLQDTINSNFVDRVDNQIYINQAYFFNPTASCSSQDMCFTGLQLCQPHNISSLALNFDGSGVVTEFYLTYSIDGRSYNCYNSCARISVSASANSTYKYSLSNLLAQGVRIYPTKYSGKPNFSPTFYYQ